MGIFIVMIIITAIFFLYSYYRHSMENVTGMLSYQEELESVSQLELFLYKALMPANDYLIYGNKEEREEFKNIDVKVHQLFQELEEHDRITQLRFEEQKLLSHVQNHYVTIKDISEKLLNLTDPVGDAEGGRLMEEMDSVADHILEDMKMFHRVVRLEVLGMIGTMDARFYKNMIMILIIFPVTITFLFIYEIFLSKNIFTPITHLTKNMNDMIETEMTTTNSAPENEIRLLTSTFNKMCSLLKKSQEELIGREKLAVIGRLTGSIAHDIRHPLTTIKNSSYFLNMTLKDADEKTRKHLKFIDAELAHAEEIITSFTKLAKHEKSDFCRTDINNVIKESLQACHLPEYITLTFELDEKCPEIMADSIQMKRVFVNLASNAKHAMPEGGTLTVKTRIVKSSELGVKEEKCLNSGLKGNFVEISFEDTGSGIKKEELDKIFEIFVTTRENGIGLGLSIVKNIVEVHGGKISVESEEGKGSVFRIVFPLDL